MTKTNMSIIKKLSRILRRTNFIFFVLVAAAGMIYYMYLINNLVQSTLDTTSTPSSSTSNNTTKIVDSGIDQSIISAFDKYSTSSNQTTSDYTQGTRPSPFYE